MAFRASLHLEGEEFDVPDFLYKLGLEVDGNGRPASDIHGGELRIHVASTENTSIPEHMASRFKPVSGNVVFRKGDEEAKMKNQTLENGYIVSYGESIDVTGSQPVTPTSVVSARVLKIGDVHFGRNRTPIKEKRCRSSVSTEKRSGVHSGLVNIFKSKKR
jgi:hypothetical protein